MSAAALLRGERLLRLQAAMLRFVENVLRSTPRIAAGIPAMLMLPWRLYRIESLHLIRGTAVRDQFAPKNSCARPAPLLTGWFKGLRLGEDLNAVYRLAATMIGIAFLILWVGPSALSGGVGHVGRAGVSLRSPSRHG